MPFHRLVLNGFHGKMMPTIDLHDLVDSYICLLFGCTIWNLRSCNLNYYFLIINNIYKKRKLLNVHNNEYKKYLKY